MGRLLRAVIAAGLVLAAAPALGERPELLVVANANSPLSVAIARYYMKRREIPAENLLLLDVALRDPALGHGGQEEIDWQVYRERIRNPIAALLDERGWRERIEIILLVQGIPHRISSPPARGRFALREERRAAVDAELALLFSDWEARPGIAQTTNPFLGERTPFRLWRRDVGRPLRYLVGRLAAAQTPIDPETGIPRDVRALIDRAQAETPLPEAYLVDEDPSLAPGLDAGNAFLLRPTASALRARGLPVVHERTDVFAHDVRGIAGLVTWGSNARHDAGAPFWGRIGERLYPGGFAARAIAVPIVSTNARTFAVPVKYGQSLVTDLVAAGASGVVGHVYEPTLSGVPRPYILLREYAEGTRAIEAFYRSVPYLGWMNVYVGDPLMVALRPSGAAPADGDGDRVPDAEDNCRDHPNAAQRDTDGDGFGNLCDADVDGDGRVTTSFGRIEPPEARGDIETIYFGAANGGEDPDHDLDGDGRVTPVDVGIAQIQLFHAPGPAAREAPAP